MPANRNALIRYKTIDKCLRNRRKKWTLDMLVDAVSEALYEYEGMIKGIGLRTIQADIQTMRSDKLGYNAPIIVTDKKYYSYEDAEYSITNIPISTQDLNKMNEAVEVLKQFKGFAHFSRLNEVVSKLEDFAYATTYNQQPVIDFEKNERLKGIEYLDPVYNAIINKNAVTVTYQSFTAREPGSFPFHIWWLKEFKNRWFAVGVKDKGKKIFNLALDRFQQIELSNDRFIENDIVTIYDYYLDVIGVTVDERSRPVDVKLFVVREHAPYVETKPLHASQQVIERRKDGIVIQLHVRINFELEKEILGFGETIAVLAPERLRKRIYGRMRNGISKYNELMKAVE
ncbi:MAG: WYL domain-containing protein [Sphingobacteriales bacterium]|nr:MAG: WYL domain-containing protein [Sphingobacteriales bacterium]